MEEALSRTVGMHWCETLLVGQWAAVVVSVRDLEEEISLVPMRWKLQKALMGPQAGKVQQKAQTRE